MSENSAPTLLEMPEVPLTTIISYLGPAATINFALSSPKIAEFIKTINLNVESVSLAINRDSCEIRFALFYSEQLLRWKFVKSDYERRKNEKKSSMKIYRCEQNPLAVCKDHVEWLTDLIRFPITIAHIVGPDFDGTADLLEWNRIHQCEKLSIDLISELNGSLAPFKDLETIELIGCSFLNPEDVKNLEIPRIVIYSAEWDAEELERIILGWRNGENKKFTHLTINLKTNEIPSTFPLSLELESWDPAKRSQYHPIADLDPLDCSTARDFERPSDGLLASILLDENTMDLVVWHERFND